MQEALKIRGDDFAGRLFHALDVNDSGYITDEQFVDALLALNYGTLEDKIAFLWCILAKDSSCITRDELQQLLKVHLKTQSLSSAIFSSIPAIFAKCLPSSKQLF